MFKNQRLICNYLIFIFIFFFITNENSFSEKSLLWKISGNGLKKSSYLFGTIHLNYEKFFQIGDSALMAINNCDAFAAELFIDSSMNFVNFIYEDNNSLINYDSLFSKEELALIKDRLKKITFKKEIDLKKFSLEYIYYKILDLKKYGVKKSTFLDAHLYYIAKCLGKELVNLEDFKTQFNLFGQNLEKKDYKKVILQILKDSIDTSIFQAYIDKNLDEIFKLVVIGMDSIYLDKVLIRRNNNMLQRMVELMINKSVFFAVGVAHLCGENGLIQLLREQGYTVESVGWKNSNYSKNFKVDSKNDKWTEQNFPNYGFSVMMPGKPIFLPDNQNLLTYIDITTGIEYFMSVSEINESYTENNYKYLDFLVSSMQITFPSCEIIEKKKINSKDYFGYELLLYSADQAVRIKLFLKDKILYHFSCSTFILEKDHYDLKRYLNSVNIFDDSTINWEEFTPENKDFSVLLPIKPNFLTQKVIGSPGIESYDVYNSTLISENETFLIFSYNFDNEYYYTNNDLLNEVLKEVGYKMLQKLPKDSTEITVSGIRVKIYKNILKDEKAALMMFAFNYYRKAYCIYAFNKKDTDTSDIIKFINSFKFNYKENPNFQKFEFEKCKFDMPEIPKFDTLITYENSYLNNMLKRTVYCFTDKNACFNFLYSKTILNEFYKGESDSTELFNYVQRMTNESDSIAYSIFKFETFPTLYYKIISPNINEIEMIGKVIINGKTIDNIYAKGLPGVLEKNKIKDRIDYFSSIDNRDKWEISKNKFDEILDILAGNDSLKIFEAKNCISQYEIKDDNIDKVFHILRKKFSDDTSFVSIKGQLISNIDSNHYSKVLPFIKLNFDKIATSTEVEIKLYNLLARINNNESFSFLLEKLEEINKVNFESADFDYLFMNISDYSIIPKFTNELLKLQKDTLFKYAVYELLNTTLDSNPDISSKLEFFEKDIRDFCLSEYENYINIDSLKENYWSNFYKIRNGLLLLSRISKNNDNIELYQRCLNDKAATLSSVAAIGLINQDQKVNERKINEFAENLETRSNFYKLLKDIKKLQFFPEKFKNQKQMGISELWNYLNSDEIAPDTIIFVEDRVREKNGQKELYYIYKIVVNEDDAVYTGITGPYAIIEDKNNLLTETTKTMVIYSPFSRLEIERNFDKWIEENEEKYY